MSAARWDLVLRRQRLAEELASWSRKPKTAPGGVLTPPIHLELLRDAARRRLEDAARATDAAQATRDLADAEAAWQVYRQADAQRRDRHLGRAVQWADAIAFEGYHAVFDRAVDSGLSTPARAARVPVPLTVVEAGLGPATFPRGTEVSAPGITAARGVVLPFPVVLLPPDHLAMPGWLSVILHEVGHDLDHDLGLRAPIGLAWQGLLKDTGRADAWTRWLPEILADQLALRLAGPPFVDALLELAGGLQGPQSWNPCGVHPPVDLRVALLAPDRGDPLPPQAAAYVADWPRLRDALWGTPVGAEAKVPLGDLVPETPGPWCRIPGQVQVELARTHVDERGPIGLALFGRLAAATAAPQWVLPEAWRSHLHERVPRLAPTHLERAGSLYKVPPLHLMIEFDRICFVGKDNGQLLPRLRQAFAERGARPWERIDLVFVDDEARPALERELPGWAASWGTWRHPGGDLYASLWSRQEAGVRHVHVHLSARIWGRDIRRSPAIDYRSTSPDLAADPEIHEALEGLATVLHPSRRLGGTDAPAPW